MKKLQMKKLVGTVLFSCVCAGLILADPPKPSAKDASVADTLKQLEQDFGDAIKAVDTDKINQILTDDWVSLGSSGKILTREGFLSDLKSGNHKLESFEIGPMDVKVLDNVAVVQGAVTEREPTEGKTRAAREVGWMFS
jgi:hypothetical protein